MKTKAGIELNEKEITLVKALQKLEKDWKKNGKDLWLYSGDGTLWVMMRGGTKRNPHSSVKRMGGVNDENSITSIDIENDGGGW